MLVDSHCHLDYLARDGDIEPVVERARAAGLAGMLTISTTLSGFPEVLAIAERHDDVWCSVGVHPHEAAEEGQEKPDRLVGLAKHGKVVGIGETGLDYYYEHSPRQAQQASFRAHIAAARQTGLPVIVHTRDAEEDTIGILREEMAAGEFSGVIHCFSSDRALAEAALDIGLSISVAGIVTFKKAEAIREAVAAVPLERLLVETDAPYLSPVPLRGKRNEPANVVHTAAKVAEIKGLAPEALAAATTENFHRLFARTKPAAS
ncbi:MAG: TatD family hydrolase [Kiloniellales bacterium]|nr:TatD family hydrolase [Kiloniellales bacterium]